MPTRTRPSKGLRRIGAALFALAFTVGVMSYTSRPRQNATAVEKALATVLYPLQSGMNWVTTKVKGVAEATGELVNLRAENAKLRAQAQAAAQADAQNQMLRTENQNLRVEMQMKAQAQYPLLTADVIGRFPDNWYQTVTIDRGSHDGVAVNMAVVNWQGLVGKISKVTPYTSTVQLLVDAGFGETGFGAGAKLPTRELGFVETVQGGFVRMKFFNGVPVVQLGQPVFTSGQGVIPPDLLIGYAESVSSGESTFDKHVNIRPAVDFHRLDVVHVVMKRADGGATAP